MHNPRKKTNIPIRKQTKTRRTPKTRRDTNRRGIHMEREDLRLYACEKCGTTQSGDYDICENCKILEEIQEAEDRIRSSMFHHVHLRNSMSISHSSGFCMLPNTILYLAPFPWFVHDFFGSVVSPSDSVFCFFFFCFFFWYPSCTHPIHTIYL